MYFNMYENTYSMFSWLKPTMLNINRGEHRIMNRKIFMLRFLNMMFSRQNINMYQMMFTIAVE